MNPDMLQLVLITVVTAATPLFIAATGELVAERSGVLNLGVEGMMMMGAACGFAAAYLTGSTLVGAGVGIVVGAAMAALFATADSRLRHQPGGGGLGAHNLRPRPLRARRQRVRRAQARSGARISRSPASATFRSSAGWCSARIISSIAPFGLILVGVVYYVIRSTRAGLVLRAVGDNHVSAHALGVPVRKVRFLAVLFGGACAGLAGAYLSLAYTPFWSPGMTAGRGWIALALTVFASWRPLAGRWRCALLFGGATVLQLNAQALGIGLPGQFMSAIPYLVPRFWRWCCCRCGAARARSRPRCWGHRSSRTDDTDERAEPESSFGRPA